MHVNIRTILAIIVLSSVCSLSKAEGFLNNTDIRLTWNGSPKEIPVPNNPDISYYIGFEGDFVNGDKLPVWFSRFQVAGAEIEKVDIIEARYDTLPAHLWKYVAVEKIGGQVKLEYNVNLASGLSYLNVELVPLRWNKEKGCIERLLAFKLDVTYSSRKSLKSMSLSQYPDQSVLKDGNWYKFKVAKSGIFKLTYADIKEKMGMANPSNISLWGLQGGLMPEINDGTTPTDLLPIPFKVYKGSNGIFDQGDYILFYLEGPNSWDFNEQERLFEHEKNYFSYYTYYYITDSQKGTEIGTRASEGGTATHTVNSFDDFAYHELDTVSLIQSGREWFGEKFSGTVLSYQFNFNFPNLDRSQQVFIDASLLNRSEQRADYILMANNSNIGSYSVGNISLKDYTGLYARNILVADSFYVNNDQIQVKVQYVPKESNAEGFLDYIRLNARRELVFTDGQMPFRDIKSMNSGNVSKFRVRQMDANHEVWEITNFFNPKSIQGSLAGDVFEFTLKTDALREFIAFDRNKAYKPILDGSDVGTIANQDLHGLTAPDYVIITHKKFEKYANELAQLHRDHSGLSVHVVDQEAVFNEFSSGRRDAAAIRNFVKMFHDRTNGQYPRYLLLFGDGSYDNKRMDPNNPNYILTYQSVQSLHESNSYVTDDYFTLLDDNEKVVTGAMDIGVGRFPVFDTIQAKVMVEKVKTYMGNSTFGAWRNNICFIGDDEESYVGVTHMYQANKLAAHVKDKFHWFNENKIFSDAYRKISTANGARYPEVNKAIFRHMEKGALIMNYTGHGSEWGLAHEQILTGDDINNWKNWGKFPVFVTATCEFARFDLVGVDNQGRYTLLSTAGEQIVLHPKGGAVASFTTTRVVYSSPNYNLNKNFYNNAFSFNKLYNERNRLGDVMKLSKNNLSHDSNKLNFSLLGDPALMLAYKEHVVKIDSINGQSVNELQDTLAALDHVSVSGHIEKSSGEFFSGFNGTLIATVYDKPQEITTLDNNKHGLPFHFELQNQVLFNGKATVKDGRFKVEFIIPKDIAYVKGKGKISCYAYNGETDAAGWDTSLVIGGFSQNSYDDNTGPEIEMYMNNVLFKENGITNESPTLLVKLEDESGISTTTSGIGHEMVAVIDNNFSQPIIMNDFYESDMDSYKKGSIFYPLLNISPGEHTVWIKVWDILNNSSESSINFVVKASNKLILQNVYNYPNPVSTTTDFVIEHNLAGDELEVTVKIYDMSGQLIKILYNRGQFSGYMSPVITWNGLGDNGNVVGDGLYFYQVQVQSEKGKAEKSSKMMIVR
jgi:hypothetical protein